MEVISGKNLPITSADKTKHNSIWSYGIVFGHKSDEGWQLGYSTATNIYYWIS